MPIKVTFIFPRVVPASPAKVAIRLLVHFWLHYYYLFDGDYSIMLSLTREIKIRRYIIRRCLLETGHLMQIRCIRDDCEYKHCKVYIRNILY